MTDIIIPNSDEIDRYGQWLKQNTPKFPEIFIMDNGLPAIRIPSGLQNLEFDDSARREEMTDWENIRDVYGIELPDDWDILYHESVQGWSWGSILTIVQHNGEVFACLDDDKFELREVTLDEAIEMVIEFEG